jgi:ABC-type transport system involved in multi-copper enzyme maturation permease subunit
MMTIGKTFLMELKTSWKVLLMFSVIIWITAYGIVEIYPTMKEGLMEELEGAQNVHIVVPDGPGGMIELNWTEVPNATGYLVLQDNRSEMLTATILLMGVENSSFDEMIDLMAQASSGTNVTKGISIKMVYFGEETNVSIPNDSNETLYFAVIAYDANAEKATAVGMQVSGIGGNPFSEMLDNPGFSSFTRGRNIDFMEIDGFLAFEFFSWYWMLMGFFLAYVSVTMITSDYESKRMDLIFSTPLSRTQYIIEKFGAMAFMVLILSFFAYAGLAMGVADLGQFGRFSNAAIFASVFTGYPFYLAICAFGILCAVIFHSGKAGMGLNFGFLLTGFIFLTFAGFSKSTEKLQYLSIHYYWDYMAVIADHEMNWGYFGVLTALSLVLVILSIYIFNKRDIPA